MTKRSLLKIEIHTLDAQPPLLSVIDPTPDGLRFEMYRSPLQECRECLPEPGRGLAGCGICAGLHCSCCGEDAVRFLAVLHPGGVILCAACVVGRSTAGCGHEEWRESAVADEEMPEARPEDRRPE